MLQRKHPSVFIGCLAWTCLLLILFTPLHAQWSEEDGGVLVSTGVNLLYHILPDGEGGAWIAYDIQTLYTSNTYLQRIDNDGVKQFGDGYGISIGPGDRNIYLGLLPADSGAVWVTYLNDTTIPAYGFSAYAQKVRLDGTFTFDSTGVILATYETRNQREMWSINPHICSDDAGGLWQVFRVYVGGHYGLGIAGLNADGTAKMTTSTVLYGGYTGEAVEVGICEDELGGAWVVWEDQDHNDQTQCQRVNAGGELVFNGSTCIYPLCPGMNNGQYSCVPDGNNGFFLSLVHGNYGVGFQHVTESRSLLWSDYGILVEVGPSCTSSEILRMPDSSLVVIAARSRTSANLIRMNSNGTVYYDSLKLILDTVSNVNNAYSIYSPSACCSDGAGGIFGFYGWNNDDFDTEGIRVHRINNDGELYWGNDSVFVAYDLLRHPSIGRTKCVSIPDRHEAIVSVFKGRGGAAEIWLYKVTGDGRVAGRDTVAVEQQISAAEPPEDFRILSAWPNPFNSTTHAQIALTTPGSCSFLVYDRLGRCVFSENTWLQAGYSTWNWAPSNALSSGIYFLQIQGPQGVSASKPLILLK